MTFVGRHLPDTCASARSILARALALAAACVLGPLPATGQGTTSASDRGADKASSEQSIAAVLPEGGDPGGVRKALGARGISYGFNYVGDWQTNVAGGLSQGGVYIGRLEGIVDVDLAKLAGWEGLTFHANAFQIHGDGLSREHVGNLLTVSYIEALASTRLSELWLEQRLLGDALSVRFGQVAADTEFNISTYANQFINATFGWPTMMGLDLPSGGPVNPLATPGVRVKLDAGKSASVLVGVFNGDPAGPGESDPGTRNRYGLNFRMQDPVLLIVEGQYRYNQDKGATGLAGSIKLGAWHHFGVFDDPRFDPVGLSLADPASDPAKHHDNQAFYLVIDQQLWRPPTGEADKGVGVFARVSAGPADRDLIDLYVDGGIVFAGLIPGRPDDVLSFGGAFARLSSRARQLDADVASLTGSGLRRDFEAAFEANYQAQILQGLQIDLDLQRIFHPGGNIAGPDGTALPDATVLTVHTSIKY